VGNKIFSSKIANAARNDRKKRFLRRPGDAALAASFVECSSLIVPTEKSLAHE